MSFNLYIMLCGVFSHSVHFRNTQNILENSFQCVQYENSHVIETKHLLNSIYFILIRQLFYSRWLNVFLIAYGTLWFLNLLIAVLNID